jgi:hypothetical protein
LLLGLGFMHTYIRYCEYVGCLNTVCYLSCYYIHYGNHISSTFLHRKNLWYSFGSTFSILNVLSLLLLFPFPHISLLNRLMHVYGYYFTLWLLLLYYLLLLSEQILLWKKYNLSDLFFSLLRIFVLIISCWSFFSFYLLIGYFMFYCINVPYWSMMNYHLHSLKAGFSLDFLNINNNLKNDMYCYLIRGRQVGIWENSLLIATFDFAKFFYFLSLIIMDQ